jgi:hypothetical protein
MSEVSFHYAVGVKAEIVEGVGYNLMRVELDVDLGKPDKFAIYFKHHALGKFRMLAEAITTIFGETTDPSAAGTAQSKEPINDR